MSKTGKVILAISGIAMLLLLGRLWFAPGHSNPLQYHLSRIRDLEKTASRAPSKLRDYLRPSVWRWYFHGRPSFQEHLARVEDHRQALVNLGYYEKRDFILRHRVWNRSAISEFSSFFTNTGLKDRSWSLSVSGESLTTLTVIASTNDMPLWAEVVSRFDSNGTR
jgi:hypothetical protein